MPNKKISQLSQISPVPTGGLMILANSGVSRSASVKDIADAVASTNTTFSGLTDTPDGISGDMFVVGHPDGTGLTFSKNLHLGTGNYLDKTVGGTISGDVTMATGEKIQFANSNNFINSAGDNIAIRTDGFIKMRSTSGTNIYQLGGTEARINYFTGFSDSHKVHVIETNQEQYISSGLNHVLHSDTDISGKIFQSGKEIDTGLFALKTSIVTVDTGDLVGQEMTGNFVDIQMTGLTLVGQSETGQFVNTGVTGLLVKKSETGDFIAGSGVPNNISARWVNTGELTSGITIDNGEDFFPNTARATDLGRSSNRWKTVHSERIVMNATGSTDDGLDAYASLRSTFTGNAYAEFLAMNSDSDTLELGISSTGALVKNIGSGNYYLKGGGGSGKQLVIGDKHDILFFANTGIGVSDSDLNPPAVKIHTSGLVTFSDAFTMPTGDGSANQFLQTDGGGNVSWASATTSTGNLVGQEMTGSFVDTSMTGILVGTGDTGNFAQFFSDLDDTPGSLGTEGQSVVVGVGGSSLVFSGVSASGGGGGELTGLFTSALNDTPSSYAGHGGSLVVVTSAANGIEFKESGDFVGAAETGNLVDTSMTGILVGTGDTGDFVTTSMTGILVGTGDTGNFVTQSQTGNFVDINMTGNLVDQGMTGILVGTGLTGVFVQTGHTGNLVDTAMTGAVLVGKEMTGILVGDAETGVFLTEPMISGTYSTQFDVNVAGGKYYLSEITAGSHITTAQVQQPTVNLHRGHTYKFKVKDTSLSAGSHPFYITATGNGGDSYAYEYTSGVTNSRVQTVGHSLIFRVPQDAPEKLYYQCGNHGNMGGTLKIHDNTGSLVGSEMTGNFIDIHMSGNFVGQEMTGNFYSKNGGDISGNASILGDSGLYVSGDVQVQSGVSYHAVSHTGNGQDIDWSVSNIQYQDNSSAVSSFNFFNVKDGQTLTLYIKNTTASNQSVNFVSGSPNSVMMPADAEGNNTVPKITANRTNVYTFVRINTGIFTSYVTGYDYR